MAWIQNPTAFTVAVYTGTPAAFTAVDISAVIGGSFNYICQLKIVGNNYVTVRPFGNTAAFEEYYKGRGPSMAKPLTVNAPNVRLFVCTNNGKFEIKSASPVTVYVVGYLNCTAGADPTSASSLYHNQAANGWRTVDISSQVGSQRVLTLCHQYTLGRSSLNRQARSSDEIHPMNSGSYFPSGPCRNQNSIIYWVNNMIMTTTDTAGNFDWNSPANNDKLYHYTHGYTASYVKVEKKIVSLAVSPTSWTTIDCTVDTAMNPTGITGKALLLIKIYREAGSYTGSQSHLTVRNPADPVNYHPNQANRQRPMGGAVVSFRDGESSYVIIETNDSGEIEYITQNDPAVPARLDVYITGYVDGPPPCFSPIVTLISPVAGYAVKPSTSIVIDTTDDVSLRDVFIYAEHGKRDAEVVWGGELEGFAPKYSGSTRHAITDGYRYTINRVLGWHLSPVIHAIAIDGQGNIDSASPDCDSDATDPVISLISPPVMSSIISSSEVILDITDTATMRDVWIYVELSQDTEVIWGGDAEGFAPRYAGSTRSAIANGYRYTIIRDGRGWCAPPTFHAIAIDTGGNQT